MRQVTVGRTAWALLWRFVDHLIDIRDRRMTAFGKFAIAAATSLSEDDGVRRRRSCHPRCDSAEGRGSDRSPRTARARMNANINDKDFDVARNMVIQGCGRPELDVIEDDLPAASFFLRYRGEDSDDDARALFKMLVSVQNNLGLSKERDPAAGRLVGNFSQASSPRALIILAPVLGGRPLERPGESGAVAAGS